MVRKGSAAQAGFALDGDCMQLEPGQSGQRPVLWIITRGLCHGIESMQCTDQCSDHSGTRMVAVDGMRS